MTYKAFGMFMAAALALAGCIGPEEPEQTKVLSYQKKLVQEGPLHRADEKAPLGLMRPLGEPGVVELSTRSGTVSALDAKGAIASKKTTFIDLSLEEVVLRTLTNSPERANIPAHHAKKPPTGPSHRHLLALWLLPDCPTVAVLRILSQRARRPQQHPSPTHRRRG